PVGRVVAGNRDQLVEDFPMITPGGFQLEEPDRGPAVPLLKRLDLAPESISRQVRERGRSAPQRERLSQKVNLRFEVTLPACFFSLPDEPSEKQRIDVLVIDSH